MAQNKTQKDNLLEKKVTEVEIAPIFFFSVL